MLTCAASDLLSLIPLFSSSDCRSPSASGRSLLLLRRRLLPTLLLHRRPLQSLLLRHRHLSSLLLRRPLPLFSESIFQGDSSSFTELYIVNCFQLHPSFVSRETVLGPMDLSLSFHSPTGFLLTVQKPYLRPHFRVQCSLTTTTGVSLGERPWKTSDARLVLEDGSVWKAKSFGATGTQVGEVVFNTSLTGYQEILTDPSYAGQFVLMTNPHIGNTGVNLDDEESRQCFLGGLVIRSLSISTSNWRCAETLGDYLARRNVMGIYDVDTRAITRRLREDGSLIGVLSTEKNKSDDELLQMSRSWDIVGVDLISGVSCQAPFQWVDKTGGEWDFNTEERYAEEFHVVAYDFGIKSNILRRLASYGCKITVVPSTWPAAETLKMKPNGILFSNGPGDPSAVPYAVETVKELIGKVPVFGICMGHQLLGQALGGTTFKMKFGHHGGNHPVRNLQNGRVEISSQNHNYAVDPKSLPEGVEVTHINLNDGSCAGLAFPAKNIMSIQYHPEASPGPHDSDAVFKEFVELMKRVKTQG